MVKNKRYFEGVGRRKEATARVRITPSRRPTFFVNDNPGENYFKAEIQRRNIQRVLKAAKMEKEISISAHVSGGGQSGQADAVALGLARALLVFQPELKKILRENKLLTRDARVKERRKFGLKKARKAPQWSKR